MQQKNKRNFFLISSIIILIILGILYFFNKSLAIGFFLISILTIVLFLILSANGIKNRSLRILFLIVLFIHIVAVIFCHYTNFQPFSGGYSDASTYDLQGRMISQGLKERKIPLRDVIFNSSSTQAVNYFPIFVGLIYNLTVPDPIVAKLVNAWLVALSALFVFLIVLELGFTRKWAFFVGLITGIYPSYGFYTSLLLKEALYVSLILAGLFLTLKLMRNFSWSNFLFLFAILIIITNIRFYISYALLFTFIICWFLSSELNLKKKIIYGSILIIFLGFVPEIGANHGFYGIDAFKSYLNKNQITFYREKVYTYEFNAKPSVPAVSSGEPSVVSSEELPEKPSAPIRPPESGFTSTVVIKTEFGNPFKFLINYFKSFTYTVFGPFPWHIKYARQALILFETIPFYCLFYFIIKGIIRAVKTRNKLALPLVVFSFMTFGIIALYITNFGIITRLRMSAFIAISCLIPFGFDKNNLDKIINFNKFTKVKKIWGKVF